MVVVYLKDISILYVLKNQKMKNSKLIKILKKLSAREQNRLHKYVQSPFFNKHEDVLQLYDVLMGFAPEFEAEALKKERIQQALGIKDVTRLNHISSYLLNLTIDFLGQLEQEKDTVEQQRYKVKALRKRNMKVALSTAIKQYERLQSRYPYQDTSYYQQQYYFYQEKDALFLLESSRRYDINLQLKSDALDLYYMVTQLQLACDMASRNIIVEADYISKLGVEIELYLQKNITYLDQHPAVAIYYTILQMLTKTASAASSYRKLKALLIQHIELFSITELQHMFDYAQNYCIQQINKGVFDYYEEFLSLYKIQLSSNTLLKDGFLEEWDFKNIVTAGVRMKDFEWTEQFIRSNKDQLKPELQENAYRYNLAVYYYATSQYKEALQLLYQVEFTDSTYHLGAKNIQLKSYYELGESDAFGALVDAFRIYVKRNKALSTYRKEVYFNFLRIAKKMENLKQKKAYIDPQKFEKEKELLAVYIKENIAANSDWIATAFGVL